MDQKPNAPLRYPSAMNTEENSLVSYRSKKPVLAGERHFAQEESRFPLHQTGIRRE